MSAEQIFRALGLIDGSLIDEALPGQRRPFRWRMPAAFLAACLTVVLGLGWFVTGGFQGFGSGAPSGGNGASDGGMTGGEVGEAAESGGGYSGIDDGTVFMSYAGPVLPLTTTESCELTAVRTVTWDFSPGTNRDGSPRHWGASVMDAYELSNPTDADVAVTALYPFAGNFQELSDLRPVVSVDGQPVETELYAGAYSGGFQSTFGADLPDTMNLDTLDSWKDYQALLESGDYLARALADHPIADVPVTAYQFTDLAAPHEKYQAATQAVSFTIDENATQIFTYGFNGMESDENSRRYSYFVPDGKRRESDTKMLIVLGEDIGDYSLQGYKNGGCNRGEEIEGVSCTVTRTETTFGAVLGQLCRVYAEEYTDGLAVDLPNAFDAVSFEIYLGAVSELLTQYGLLSGAPMDRYSDGRLDDLLSETLSHDRVLYLAFPVTVPAGGSVRVDSRFWKEPSYDFQCSGSENADLQGYDLVTSLGSTLTFTRQFAALVNVDGLEIAGQNYGFELFDDPQSGRRADPVELDPSMEHYFLEVRALEG